MVKGLEIIRPGDRAWTDGANEFQEIAEDSGLVHTKADRAICIIRALPGDTLTVEELRKKLDRYPPDTVLSLCRPGYTGERWLLALFPGETVPIQVYTFREE
jgi:hypothetical protein